MKKYNILYIEDNTTDFEMVKAILEDEEVINEIRRVENKQEFIHEIQTWEFDIILTDYSLPAFHGIEAINIAKELCPEIPIIMITGNLSDEVAVDTIKKGAWDYVLKENVYRLIPSIKAAIERQQDRAEKQRALDALRESEENYRILAESSPYGIIVHSDEKIVYYNKQAINIFKADENYSFIGTRVLDFVHPDFKEISLNNIFRLYRGIEDNRVKELKYINAHSEELVLEIVSSPIRFQDKPAAQVIFSDIAERKKMEADLIRSKEKAEESDRLKTAFLENMSHEIRTPLNGIIGFASLLKYPDLKDEDKLNYIKIIEESGKHLLNIIDDLIEVSRLETGQIELKIEQINLNEVLDEIFIFFRDGTKFKNIPVQLKLNKGLSREDSYVEADKGRLTQILYNLIYNAYKFTSEGTIEFGYETKLKDSLVFYVKDTGIGIAEKARKVVFERFRQADDSTTRIYGGTGLGLTISKGLVSAMDGNIWFDSEVGKGTSFYFELPLKQFSIVKSTTVDKIDQTDFNWREKSVLIAEDEMSNFILLKHILGKTGISITHVRTGNDIVKKINEGNIYDLLLLDIKMPGMSGIEALQELRENNIQIPAIAQTAYAMADDKQKCLAGGFNDYITKPIKSTELLQKMQAFLNA